MMKFFRNIRQAFLAETFSPSLKGAFLTFYDNNESSPLGAGGQTPETFSPSLKGAFLTLYDNNESSPIGTGGQTNKHDEIL